MLASGHPTDSWDKLLKKAMQESARLNSAAAWVNCPLNKLPVQIRISGCV